MVAQHGVASSGWVCLKSLTESLPSLHPLPCSWAFGGQDSSGLTSLGWILHCRSPWVCHCTGWRTSAFCTERPPGGWHPFLLKALRTLPSPEATSLPPGSPVKTQMRQVWALCLHHVHWPSMGWTLDISLQRGASVHASQLIVKTEVQKRLTTAYWLTGHVACQALGSQLITHVAVLPPLGSVFLSALYGEVVDHDILGPGEPSGWLSIWCPGWEPRSWISGLMTFFSGI
jgi:hypothetical protein